MPLTKSAKKALKVSVRRKKENNLVRAKIKNAVKGARRSVISKQDTAKKLQDLYHEVDIAAKKHAIHKNKAARLKSRITKQAAKAGSDLSTTKTKKTARGKATKK